MNEYTSYTEIEFREQLGSILPCACDELSDGEPACLPCYVRHRMQGTFDRQQAEIARLREALRPIVEALEAWMDTVPDSDAIPILVQRADGSQVTLTRGHIAAGRSALASRNVTHSH